MRTLEHEMLTAVDHPSFLLRIAAPEHEDQTLSPIRQSLDGCIGEGLPALALMRTCLASLDGESGIEKKHALIGPSRQVAIGHVHCHSIFLLQFLIDIYERGRRLNAVLDREAQSVSLVRTMIWILSEYHNLDLVEWRAIESLEDL